MSNVGKWDPYYVNTDRPWAYDDPTTYGLGLTYLFECATIEDWGCGPGWFAKVARESGYAGTVTSIDGSQTPNADLILDLATYTTGEPEGVFMRHVLEHNVEWRSILANALAAARHRIALVLFTPLVDGPDAVQIAWNPGYGVPDLSLPIEVIESMFLDAGFTYDIEDLRTATGYSQEYVIRGERR